MRRIYEPEAYGPQLGCYWTGTTQPPTTPRITGDETADIAIIGGGFTGLNAALALARKGRDMIVLDAERPGWGASGRNGGFCCLGGAKASDQSLARRFGQAGLADWRATEKAAVRHVDALLSDLSIDADRHSRGETLLAHTPRAYQAMQADAEATARAYGTAPVLHAPQDLPALGMGGPWHGGVTLRLGFALNPAKYHTGLAKVAAEAGVRLRSNAPVTELKSGLPWQLQTPTGAVTAKQVVLATNGYSSEDLPDWLRARYLPVQSSIIVTRPLSDAELAAQGWTSDQMAYDSRKLLHYFRLLPERRFLFGMRGGLRATPTAQRAISTKIRADFHRLFPAWQGVEITHEWSGLVCLMPGLTPFVGPVPGHDGLFAGMGYHGNGVAMGSYSGALLGAIVAGETPDGPWPEAMRRPPNRFPLGRYRRALLAPAYWAAEAFDL